MKKYIGIFAKPILILLIGSTNANGQHTPAPQQLPIPVELSRAGLPEFDLTAAVNRIKAGVPGRRWDGFLENLRNNRKISVTDFWTLIGKKRIFAQSDRAVYSPALQMSCKEVKRRFKKSVKLLDKATKYIRKVNRRLDRGRNSSADRYMVKAQKIFAELSEVYPNSIDEKLYTVTYHWDLSGQLNERVSDQKITKLDWGGHNFDLQSFPGSVESHWSGSAYKLSIFEQSLTNICLDNSGLLVHGSLTSYKENLVHCGELCRESGPINIPIESKEYRILLLPAK